MSDGLTKLGEAARRARAAISPWNFFSPTDVAGVLPGGGIPSAAEPYKQGLQKTAEATKAFREGRYGDAAKWYGSGVLDTGTAALSALPEGGALTKLAMAVAPAVKAVAGSADEVADGAGAMRKMAGIRAFHGSPHDFDRFSMDKIGTGEGAQAYGHGLYFAESEGVARSYRDNLSGGVSNTGFMLGSAPYKPSKAEKFAADILRTNKGDYAAARAELSEYAQFDAEMAAHLKQLNQMEKAGIRGAAPGSMYEVRINADPEQFLDWDKPLSEQSEAVRQTLQQRYPQYFEERLLNPFTRMPVEFKPGSDVAKLRDFYVNQQGYPVERAADSMTAKTLAERHNFDPPSMSRELNEAGIPGIKYLDAGSRSAGDGSRNYVVFDDKLVEIVKKYGWAPGMAIPAAMALEIQQAQEQSAPQM